MTVIEIGNRKQILTISLTQHLHGQSISKTIEKEWSTKATPRRREAFKNEPFDLDPSDIGALRSRLQTTEWDGVIVGWCIRGSGKEFTPVFENVVETITDVQHGKDGQRSFKLMFCKGPDDIFDTTMRHFGPA